MRWKMAIAVSFVFSISASAENLLPNDFELVPSKPELPQVYFTDESANEFKINSFRGKILVINFWATWCGPCVKELPSLQRLILALPSETHAVLAISQDKGGVAVTKPYLAKIGVNLPIYFDPAGRLFRALSIRGMPTTFIVDSEGRLLSRFEGSTEWDREDIVSYLKSLKVRP